MSSTIATLHMRSDDAAAVAAEFPRTGPHAAAVLESRGGWVSVYDESAERGGIADLRRLAQALSRAARGPAVGLLLWRGASAILAYDRGAAAGVSTSDAELIAPTAQELVAADPVDALLRLMPPGTDRDEVAEALLRERDDEASRLTDLAALLGIDAARAGARLADVWARASGGEGHVIGTPSAPPTDERSQATAAGAGGAADPRSLELYATAVAMIAKAGELYSEMADQLGDEPTPQMLELFELGRKQYFDQLDEMLRDAAYPSAPPIEEMSRAATAGPHVLAALLATRTPRALEAVALHIVRAGQGALLQALLKHHVNRDAADAEGRSLLMLACMSGHEACVEALLAAGALVEARDSFGHTSLLHAARHSPAAVIERLLRSGADARATAPGGVGALDLARYNPDQSRVAAILRAAGAAP